MIDLYYAPTPNGWKISIMLEECEIDYKVITVNLGKGDQFKPDFLKISPNNRMPVIVDHEHMINDQPLSIFESGAILMYLANRTGQLMSSIGPDYWRQMEWLMFQMGGVGPMLGQTHHFVKFNPGKSTYAEARYSAENRRLYGVLDKRLAGRDYICDEYSIADIATWPWISRYEWQQMNLNEFPHLKDWYLRVAVRPAVQRGYAVPQDLAVPIPN